MNQKKSTGIAYTYLMLVAAMLCWGLSFVWYKQALENFPPVTLVLARLLLSLPLLFISALLLKRLKKIKREDIPLFLFLAFLKPFLYFIGESLGMQYISSTVAAIVISTIPLFMVMVMLAGKREKLHLLNYLGILVSFVGVIFVVLSDRDHMVATHKGILLMMIAVFAAVGYGFVIKKAAERYNSLTIVTTQNFLGAIYFIPVYFIFDHQKVATIEWKINNLMPLFYLAIFASTFAYLGYIQGVRKLGVSKATVFTNFIPVFTAIFALIILGDSMNLLKVAGIVFVVSGLVLSQAGQTQKDSKPEVEIVNELY